MPVEKHDFSCCESLFGGECQTRPRQGLLAALCVGRFATVGATFSGLSAAPSPTPSASRTPTTSAAAADDWAQAGHDPAENFDNAAETTISTSNAGRLTKAWSVSAGLVVSQPIVYQGEVYRLAGATSGTSAGVLSAASLATGKVRWRKSLSGPGAATLYGAGDGEVLYGLAGSTDELGAVSASTGARRWSRADEAFAGGAGEVLLDRGDDVIAHLRDRGSAVLNLNRDGRLADVGIQFLDDRRGR